MNRLDEFQIWCAVSVFVRIVPEEIDGALTQLPNSAPLKGILYLMMMSNATARAKDIILIARDFLPPEQLQPLFDQMFKNLNEVCFKHGLPTKNAAPEVVH